jgi:hypothetical protein
MEILNERQYRKVTSLTATFTVSPSGTYTLDYEDLYTGESFSASATTISGAATFTLNSKYLDYTGSLAASVKNSDGDTVIMTNIDVVRPYCNLDSVASALSITDGSEITFERLARYIIDSQTQGFPFVRKEKDIVGNGSDYLPIDEKIYKIYKIYENQEIQYDSTLSASANLVTYEITKDQTSITNVDDEGGPENKVNNKVVWRERYLDSAFGEGSEYRVDGDFGWKVIPQDIQEACELLIQDIKEDNLKYINRYIESFDNEDFKIKFVKNPSTGTGNMFVDKILEKYRNRLRIGVL